MASASIPEHELVIAGAGPTGLMLAAELALAGVDVAVVERRALRELESARGGGLHSRTIELLDQRGVAGRFLAAGRTAQVQAFAYIPLDISDFATRHPYGLALPQSQFEPILAAWVAELGVTVRHGEEVTGFEEDPGGVTVELAGGGALRAAYLAGCDGGRSAVRRTAGIEFPGTSASTSWLIAEVEMSGQPELGMRREKGGAQAIARLPDSGLFRVVLTEATVGEDRAPHLDDLRAALVRVYGSDFGVDRPRWISRFTDMTRQAAAYRRGRVVLAGDASHVHPPLGGQGLNTGVQDAVNLGWKLAQVVKGTAPESLLDTYHAERHPVGARVLSNTMAQVALSRTDERSLALHATVAQLLALDEPRRRIAGMLSGLDIAYGPEGGHPLTGRRVPDLDLETPSGPERVFQLLHAARPFLLSLDPAAAPDLGPWRGRVGLVQATYRGAWELPVLGAVPAPAAVLVRPDGHAAWAGELGDPALREALETWFGPAG